MTETEKLLQEDIDFLEKELYNANNVIDRFIELLGEAGTHIGSIKDDMDLLRRYKNLYGVLKD